MFGGFLVLVAGRAESVAFYAGVISGRYPGGYPFMDDLPDSYSILRFKSSHRIVDCSPFDIVSKGGVPLEFGR